MSQDILNRLDQQYRPIIELKDADQVREFLKKQDLVDLRLYWSSFKTVLEEKHAERAHLIEEEFERRKPTDFVTLVINWLRQNPVAAAAILLVMAVGFLASFKENICEISDMCGTPDVPSECEGLTEEECASAIEVLNKIIGEK